MRWAYCANYRSRPEILVVGFLRIGRADAIAWRQSLQLFVGDFSQARAAVSDGAVMLFSAS